MAMKPRTHGRWYVDAIAIDDGQRVGTGRWIWRATIDDSPYVESLSEHWGALCADPALASHWADQLRPLIQHVMADRRKGTHASHSP
jgi:hypothetical protein